MVFVTSTLAFLVNLHIKQGWTLLALSLCASFVYPHELSAHVIATDWRWSHHYLESHYLRTIWILGWEVCATRLPAAHHLQSYDLQR